MNAAKKQLPLSDPARPRRKRFRARSGRREMRDLVKALRRRLAPTRAALAPLAASSTFATAPEWLRLDAAAELAGGVSERTIRRWISVGHVCASKPARGVVLVSRDSLRAFIEQGVTRAA